MSVITTYVTARKALHAGTSTADTAEGERGQAPVVVQTMLVNVDFGSTGSTGARTVVTDFSWARRAGDRARPVCRVVGRPDVLGRDDEDALLDQVAAIVTNIQDGVSFDVVAHAPQGTTGLYEVQIIGV